MYSWVEERNNRACLRVNTREVWSLMEITAVAGQGEVCGIISNAMLAGNESYPRVEE